MIYTSVNFYFILMVINDSETLDDGLVLLFYCTSIRMLYRIVSKIGCIVFNGHNLALL